jgi:hypothetical protein
VEALKNNICGKVRRELVAGTLEVYPLHGFGAVEIGVLAFVIRSWGSVAKGVAPRSSFISGRTKTVCGRSRE